MKEIAEQLKNAGFPQPLKDTGEKGEWIEHYYIPTLEELIEAIGIEGNVPKFKFLTIHSKHKDFIVGNPSGNVDMKLVGRWNARGRSGVKKDNSDKWVKISAWGNTPFEALAKLYLAIYSPNL